MLLKNLQEKKIIHVPSWIPDNTIYLTIMGSMAYGTNNNDSDIDVYGVAIPRKDDIFPHLRGEILGFGNNQKQFESWQQHHVKVEKREYDLNIFGIVKYFNLCMQNNPNCIDSLFTPLNCVIHQTQAGTLIRDNRKKFLSKLCFYKFKGYAYSQLTKIKSKKHLALDDLIKFESLNNFKNNSFDNVEKMYLDFKNPEINKEQYLLIEQYYLLYKKVVSSSKRAEKVKLDGFDLKFAMHLVRLLNECEQILKEGDIDLQLNKEQLKSIRNGEMDEDYIYEWFKEKNLQLERLYMESKLQEKPNEYELKSLLLNCLEHHYGSLKEVVNFTDSYKNLLLSIKKMIDSSGL